MDYLLHHSLETSADRFPEKEVVVHGQARLNYGEVAGTVASLAAGLVEAGLRAGERAGVFLRPSPEQVLSLYAVSRAGAVFVTIHHQFRARQVKHIVTDSGMACLITDRRGFDEIRPVLGDLPELRSLVITDGDQVAAPCAVLDFDELCATRPNAPPPERIDRDLASIIYTSGSTGKPKGVMVTQANLMAGTSIVADYLRISHEDRILAALPFNFDAGLNQLTTAVQQGGTLVLADWVFARELVQMLVKERITGLGGVPTLWSLLAQPSSGLSRTPLPHLRYITNTGGALPEPILKALQKALPETEVYLMYGFTEAFRSTYLPPEELDRRPGSMGQAIPNTEILVLRDDGTPCEPGEVGELVHRGPTVSLGYWKDPEATRRLIRPHPALPPELGGGERVCYSGDLVKRDEDGFLYFVGRRDSMIKSSGYRISPTEVEEVLFASGKIGHAAVIGVPDPLLGQFIRAFVTPPGGSEEVNTDDLLEFCAENLPRYMLPREVEVVPELPRTASGKVDYQALRARTGP